jgi:phytoene dehydrogenase-like protein
MISCLFDYEITKKVENAGWYDEFKERVENRIIDLFSKSIYPGLKDDILSRLSATPVTINKVSGSSEGAITGGLLKRSPRDLQTDRCGKIRAHASAQCLSGGSVGLRSGRGADRHVNGLARLSEHQEKDGQSQGGAVNLTARHGIELDSSNPAA